MKLIDLYSPLLTLFRSGYADTKLYLFDETTRSVIEAKDFKILNNKVVISFDPKVEPHPKSGDRLLKEQISKAFAKGVI